jgi:hypothetical protein
MKKSFLFLIIISTLCLSAGYADNPSSSKVDQNAQEVENWLKGSDTKTETNTNTETITTTSTNTSTETKTDTTTQSDTSTETKVTTTSSSTDTATTASTGSPFSDDTEVKDTESAEPTKITDLETATACGIKDIAKGFPKDGKVSGTGSDNLRLRSWPWGTVIGKYPSGTSLKVLGESGEFYLVEIDGKQGYMHKNYVSTSDKAASGVAPYYPGDTRSGGSLTLKDGVQASKDGAEGKVPSTNSNPGSTTTPGSVTISGDKVLLDVPKNYQMTANVPAPGSACGPTSLSMILGFYGKGDPKKLVTDLYSVCGCTKANGTGHDGLVKGAKKYGISASWHYGSTQSWCREQLKAGKPLLCHVNHHYVVMKGMDKNGNVIINDPGKSVIERTMSWSEFAAWWNKSNSPMSCMVCN